MNVPRWIAWGCVGLVAGFLIWTAGAAHATDALVEQSAYKLLAGHTTASRIQDSLSGIMRDAKARADSLAHHPRYVTIVTAHHDTVRAIDTVWVNQQVADLNHAYSACSEALTLCRARSDSLEKSLHDVLKTRECRILFLPCPSRGAIFLLGAVGGALLEHRLTR